jgi:hypothetical protein
VPSVEERIRLSGGDTDQEIRRVVVHCMDSHGTVDLGGVVASDTVLMVKGLVEQLLGIPRVHQTALSIGLTQVENDTDKLERYWSKLRVTPTAAQPLVEVHVRLSGYTRTGRKLTAQNIIDNEARRQEEHDRRLHYTASYNRGSNRGVKNRARQHIFSDEEWATIDEDYWRAEEVRLGLLRLKKFKAKIKKAAAGDLAKRSWMYRQLLCDVPLRELDKRQCRHSDQTVFFELLRKVVKNCCFPQNALQDRNVRPRLQE